MNGPVSANIYPFLAGGGEMGELIRTKNWSDTEVGPIDTWPQSLRTTLGIMLHAKFPMFLWWGPSLTCFYNDDYRPSLGNQGKHPHILGMPAREAWTEIWDIIGPLINKVLAGGYSHWSEDQLIPIYRNGRLEDVYWTFSYSPVNDETGNINGVLVVCSETTGKVLARKKTEEEESIFRSMSDNAPVVVWTMDAEATTTFINKQWTKITGQQLKDIVGQGWQKVVHPEDIDKVDAAFKKANREQSPMSLEYRIKDINGHYRWIIDTASPRFEGERFLGHIGSMVDITARKEAEITLRAGEQRFRNTVLQAPVGIAVLRGRDFIFETANIAYQALVDKKEGELINQKLFDVLPEVKEVVQPLLEEVFDTGNPFYATELEVPLKRLGKIEHYYFNIVYQPLREADGKISGIIVIANEVTTLVAAKHRILESEKQFRNIVAQSPIPMATVREADFIIETANAAMLETMWRQEAAAVLGKKLLDVFPELSDQKYPELLRAVFTTGKAHRELESIAYVQHHDGLKKFYLDYEYAPLFETDGTVSGVMITVNDVTEKVEARQQLEDAEARVRLATEASKLATWDLNLQTQQLVYSPQLLSIFGYPETAILSHADFRSNIHKEDFDMVLAAFDEALQTGICNYEARIVLPDKSIHWIKTQGKVVFDVAHVPQRMLGTVMDITERRIAEENIIKLAAIVQSSDDAIISKRLDGIITSWNNAAERIFGYTADEIIGQHIYTLIPPERHQEEAEILAKIKKGERIQTFETQRLTKDKRRLDFSLTISPLIDQQGNITGASKIARDITSQKAAERLIKESKERLQIVIAAGDLGTWELNPKTKAFEYSDRYLEIIGYKGTDRPSHEAILKYLHPDDLIIRQQALKAAYETGILQYVTRTIDEEGVTHWVETKGKVFYDEQHNPDKLIGTSRDLTEEKIYQQRIEESEKRFKSIADTAPVLIWMAGTDKLYNFFSKAWLSFTGRTVRQELGNGWQEGVHPDDIDRCRNFYTACFDRREEFYTEYRLKRYDGEYRWISVTGKPRFTSDGIFEGYIGACMDIDDRIEFEKNLQESESRLRIAAISGELGTWEYHPLTGKLIWDNATREMFGVDSDTETSLALFEQSLHPDDREPTLQKMKRALDPAIADNFDTEYRVIANGRHTWIHAKGKALFNSEDEPYLFSGTILDVTEKRLALEELQESEEKFRLLADSMPQFVWSGDKDGKLNYFSKAVYDFSGLTPQQIEEGGWLQIVHPDDREENRRQWQHSIETGTTFIFEHRFRRADGEYRWQLSRALPQKDMKGNIQMWVGTSTDIDEIKRHEQQKDDFIKIASHELKTPITTVKGYVQLLLKTHGAGNDSFLSGSLLTINKQVSKLTKLITDLLDVTKIETGSLSLSKEVFSINEIVNEIAADIRAAHSSHAIIIHTNANPAIYADKDRISQVLNNLFTNAIKYSPNADKVLVEVNKVDGNVVVSVQDFGIGVSSKDHTKIFERFYRATGKDEKTFPGFGIGLFIVNEIISLHGGKIWVESEKDKGAVFKFSLPVHS